MNNETCIHGGVAPINLLNRLHGNQGGSGRHKCPTCAFEQGFILGSSEKWQNYNEYTLTIANPEKCPEGSIAPTLILKCLGDNQGGSGRHKCPNCAFKHGFELGILNERTENNNIQLRLVDPPNIELSFRERDFKASKDIDFLQHELNNKRLGLLGEKLVFHIEKQHLIDRNRPDLAEKLEHSSLVTGDGLGYDILSYNQQGEKKYIEVKTTRSNISRPFYLTRNELEYSKVNNYNYFLYRLFDFDIQSNAGKYYKINGDLYTKLKLKPTQYLAIPE